MDLLTILSLLLLPGIIQRHARRIFPVADRPELILLFGWAALGFGVLLWRTKQDIIGTLVGWFLITSLSLAGYSIARILTSPRR